MTLDYPVVPHPIAQITPDASTLLYVGDGSRFVLASYDPNWRDPATLGRRAAWLHAAVTSPFYREPIGIEPLYFLAVDREFVTVARPVPPAPAPAAACDERSEGWDCGNGGLKARLVLKLIERNAITDLRAMEYLDGIAYEAGVGFCRDMLGDISRDEMPF